MPYVVDDDTFLHRPSKRRRLTADLRMARRNILKEEEIEHLPNNMFVGTDPSASTSLTRPQGRHTGEIRTSNREELIECIKRGEKPTWVPSANLQALYDEESSPRVQSLRPMQTKTQSESEDHVHEDLLFGPSTEPQDASNRPRSALHRGDFNGFQESTSASAEHTVNVPSTAGSITLSDNVSLPWLSAISSSPTGQYVSEAGPTLETAMRSVSRRRAPSLGSSLSSSFVLRTPTSPLVHAVNNTSFDNNASNIQSTGESVPDRNTRRRTMPPNSFHFFSTFPAESTTPNSNRAQSNLSREPSMQQVSHQPRRSLSSFTYQPGSSPQSAYPRSRRLSFASDFSPRRRTSMVGSFEESIIHGRMSSPASQPFDFVAQIGVMGKGDCPANLKCPAHVTVPFQAVYYHYPASQNAGPALDEAPSPYVGTIDLEQNLKPVYLVTKRKRAPPEANDQFTSGGDPRAPENTSIGKALARDAEKQKESSGPSRMALGGAYRVPQKGQVQIIVKNQHKTAVKLFLIPYDLEGMDAGTKTFVRQRSYSRGPILEGALDTTAGVASLHDPLKDKHILRYLVHIRFCCPTKGKYYLNDQIRIVFANRVPDGKEKLENEIQLPEPKFSPYRPSLPVQQSSQQSRGESSITETETETKFADILTRKPHLIEVTGTPTPLLQDPTKSKKFASVSATGKMLRLPINLASQSITSQTPPKLQDLGENAEAESPLSIYDNKNLVNVSSPTPSQALSTVQGFLPSTSARASPVPWGSSSTTSTTRSFSPVQVELGDGLLSRQFRNLYSHQNRAERKDHVQNRSGSASPEIIKGTQTEEHKSTSMDEEHSALGDISLAIHR